MCLIKNSMDKWIFNMLIFIAISFTGYGQELNPVSWSFDVQKLSEQEYQIEYSADIKEGWTVYSQYLESDEGPVATEIWYETEGVVENVGLSEESGKRKAGFDKFFEMNVVKFLSGEPYVITQRVKVLDPSKVLKGYLTFMTCDDERCLPPTDVEFAFDFGKGKTLSSDLTGVGNLAAIEGNVIDQVRPALKESFKDPIASCGEESQSNSSLPWMFLFGFLGGMLALLTPCVFPMIPLTVSYFTKDNNRKGWWNGVVYGVSIIVIYVSVGLLITALFGDEALNRLSTNWIANSLFFIVFILFALSFFGFYEITLPSRWSSKTDRMADQGGLLGIFFMAFTLAIVSFSCTGPIIGTAIVQAATNQVGPFVVMFGFSLALALPFGLFAAFPSWLKSLPQSGGWMNSVKVVLGFIELALAFKFLSVADMTNNWGILRYELFLAIWIVIALAMALYGFGFIKFPHDSPLKKMSMRRWVYSLTCLGLTFYLVSGFMYREDIKSYNGLKLLSGLAPPSNYNYFLPEPSLDDVIKSKYASYSKCANNIDCFKDYYEGLAFARENNKPVLLDHTGHGCVNCRKTEEHIWVDERVRELLSNDFVLVSLYVDDDKKLNDVLVSKSRNKKMRNIGNKWADFQIVNFDQNSQPLYIMITPEERVIANPRGYREGVDGYVEYLECGLETYQSLSSR